LLPDVDKSAILIGKSKFFAKDFVSVRLDKLMEKWFETQTESSKKITSLFKVII